LTITSTEDAGDYTCQVTNSVVTDLTLCSRPIHISVTDPAIAADSLALVALYEATDGDTWTNNTNWLTGPVTGWYGVTIESGRVVNLSLTSNNLTGTLPPEIGNLEKLEILNLGYNSLSGAMPGELDSLVNLIGVNLSNNQLSGDLPAGLYANTNLIWLVLNNNSFTNIDVTAIGNMSLLESLGLAGLNLQGNLPASLLSLSNLQYLNLANNDFVGEIPAEIFNLTTLNFLDLGGNQLTGTLSQDIGNLINLHDLYLYHNQLTGAIPSTINQIPLEVLLLGANRFTDLPLLDGLANLTELRIYHNQFTFEDIEPNMDVRVHYSYIHPRIQWV